MFIHLIYVEKGEEQMKHLASPGPRRIPGPAAIVGIHLQGIHQLAWAMAESKRISENELNSFEIYSFLFT